jgi:hypothetical protein
MAPFAPPKDEALVAGYEELRRQALIGHGGTGLAVFIRRGMREWMHACSRPNSPPAAKAYARTEAEPVIPQGLQPEIILILAGMLLHGFQEACT